MWRMILRDCSTLVKHAEYVASVFDISHDGTTALVRHFLEEQSPNISELERFPSETILCLGKRSAREGNERKARIGR